MPRKTLIIMVKEPRPGQVKTRLAAGIGSIAAVWWMRHQIRRLIPRVRRDRIWKTQLSVAPHSAVTAKCWPADLHRAPQSRGDLGQRMIAALCSAPPGPVVLIGGDIPGIRAKHIAGAFKALGAADFVFGPADDGGYWLIGCRNASSLPPDWLSDVRWSSKHSLKDSIATTPGRVAIVETLSDVDTAADL